MRKRKIIPLLGNSQALDGGSMFGNAPKVMWQKWIAADNDNRVTLSTRAMLVQEEGRNILFEVGVGAFFDPKYKKRYGVIENNHVLLDSLAQHDLTHTDIDVVVLSHLHFDHAGGLLSAYKEDYEAQLLFPNAKYLVSDKAWERANNPHPRDKASFIPVLNSLIEKSGRLVTISGEYSQILGGDFKFLYSDGHTPGLLMTEVSTDKDKYLYVSDLIPGAPWVHLPITMGYDRAAELLINEKRVILDYVFNNNIKLFFTHDPNIAFANIKLINNKFSILEN